MVFPPLDSMLPEGRAYDCFTHSCVPGISPSVWSPMGTHHYLLNVNRWTHDWGSEQTVGAGLTSVSAGCVTTGKLLALSGPLPSLDLSINIQLHLKDWLHPF